MSCLSRVSLHIQSKSCRVILLIRPANCTMMEAVFTLMERHVRSVHCSVSLACLRWRVLEVRVMGRGRWPGGSMKCGDRSGHQSVTWAQLFPFTWHEPWFFRGFNTVHRPPLLAYALTRSVEKFFCITVSLFPTKHHLQSVTLLFILKSLLKLIFKSSASTR